jgi:superfamily I DNA and RNA helicase
MLTDICESKPLESPDRPKEIIGIGSDLGAMSTWFNRVVSFWHQKGDDPLGSAGVRLLEEVLCRSVAVRPVLRTAIDAAERERINLTAKQAKILRIIGGRKRAVISGGAGTGKTLIAVEKARQLMQAGSDVLFLCYNRPLADALAINIPSQDKLHVMTFHQLCERRVAMARAQSGSHLFAQAEVAYPGDTLKHRFDVQYPYALALSNETLAEKYDAIVVDEAQDFSDEYWFAIEELLRDPENGHLYIFIDQNQTLYKRHCNLPIDEEPFSLATNCRNTEPIHQAGYIYYKGEPVDSPELPGPPVIKSSFEDDVRQAEAVAQRVRQWLAEEKLEPEQIAVLIAKQPKSVLYELLSQQDLPGNVAWAFEEHGRRRTVLVDTVKRFKGLEADAVVLWVGEDVTDEEQWETLYVGTTRAKSLLCIVGSKRVLATMPLH